jgi:hypothetical protein
VNLKGVQRLYDRFAPDERLRLAITALAREDDAEAERLGRSCPRKTYTATDPDYVDRLEASDGVTLCILAELLPHLAKLRMVAAFRLYGEYLEGLQEDAAVIAYLDGRAAGLAAARQGARGRGTPRRPADEDPGLAAATERAAEHRRLFERLCDRLGARVAAEVRISWDAFGRFCRDDLGLEPEALVAAWARPALANLEEHRAALEAAEPEAGAVDVLLDVLRYAWRRRALRDQTAEISPETQARLEAEAGSPA